MICIISLYYGTNRTIFPVMQKWCRTKGGLHLFCVLAVRKDTRARRHDVVSRATPTTAQSRLKEPPAGGVTAKKRLPLFWRWRRPKPKPIAGGGNARADGPREVPKPAPKGMGEGAKRTEEPPARADSADRQ